MVNMSNSLEKCQGNNSLTLKSTTSGRESKNQSKSIASLVMHHTWLGKDLLTHEEKRLSEKSMDRNELV